MEYGLQDWLSGGLTFWSIRCYRREINCKAICYADN